VKSEKRAVDSADNADSGDDTDSMPALQMDDIHDDLKAIRGVGAKIEQKLNMLGIHNFKGLLQLESDDYDRAAELIPNLEGRMHRDAWIDQARNLHLEKYNEAI
jgi:predicted flap endonuclease-1-like 5' DNA nuclease